MNIEAFLLCDCATQQQGKLNVLGAFDSIFTGRMPFALPGCAIALRIRFSKVEEGNHQARINIIDQDGKAIGPKLEGRMSVKFVDDADSALINSILFLHKLKFQEYGQYRIDLAVDGRQVTSLPLYVKNIPNKTESSG